MSFTQFPHSLAFLKNKKSSISEKTFFPPPSTPASRGLMTPGSMTPGTMTPGSSDMGKQIQTTLPYPVANSNNVSITDAIGKERQPRPGLGGYLLSEIDTSWTDITLIICGFISGLVDGLSFNYWKSFSDMQTGNLIWAALAVGGKPNDPEGLWIKALIAVAAFLVGSVCFIQGSRILGPRRRINLIFAFLLQTLLLMGAAIMAERHAISSIPNQNPTIWLQNVAIAFLAFQAAGQILASKWLGYPEIPTVALTALMCDLLLDDKLFQWPLGANPKRNRKFGFIIVLTVGSMTAGGIAKERGLACGLWLAMAMKGALTVAFFFWKEKPPVKEAGLA